MITDTHCHLYEESFNDLAEVFSKSQLKGVHQFIIPNVDSSSINPICDLLKTYPKCYAAMGLHPTYVGAEYENELKIIKEELDKGGYIAIGEIGIDLYWSKEFIEQQKKAFETQVKWSIEKELPLIIHSREAFDEVFEILEPYKGKARGVFHSFTGNSNDAKRIINDFNFYVGINGVVTYKTSTLKEIINEIPLSQMLLETDSPYLSPVPFRGKRNDPSNLSVIATFISDILGVETTDLESQIEENVNRLFRIGR